MTAPLDYAGRILEHGQDWRFFRLDRAAKFLQPGDVIQVSPFDGEDIRFRTGECRVLGTFADFVHVERGAWQDIAAIADMDHVYLTERPTRDIGCGDHVRWHPTPESPLGGMIVEGIAERVRERTDGTRTLTVLRVTAVHRGTSLGDRGFALGSLVDVTIAPGTVEVVRRAYAPGEKMTDRHPDSVIAQVVEETIAKQVEHLATPIKVPVMTDGRHRVEVAARRPDGFDQHHVDAAKAALLAPAPPRYPRAGGRR